MRAFRRHSSRMDTDDDPEQPSTSSETPRDATGVDNKRIELIARLLSQVRANRDRREAHLLNQLKLDNPKWTEEQLREHVNEQLITIDSHVQQLEARTTGIQFEDLLKIPKYVVPLIEPSVPLRSPTFKPNDPKPPSKTLAPIEIKVEDISSEPPTGSHSLLSVNAGENNVEKAAKQEAQVIARIAELRRAGMWTNARMPLCVEPSRSKTHWDFVLEEVVWMANDFRAERIAKRKMARNISGAIYKKMREQELGVEKAEQRLLKDGRRICANIAKMIREFWLNVDKVVDYRAQDILESKKRKALDQHLAFIVGEADKLSNMVQEGLTQDKTSKTPSIASKDDQDDRDFFVNGDDEESDDESTMAKSEKGIKHEEIVKEVDALANEADQGLDDLLASLPPEYLATLGLSADALSGRATSSLSHGTSVAESMDVESDDDDNSSESTHNERPKSEVKEEPFTDGETVHKKRRIDEMSTTDSKDNIDETSQDTSVKSQGPDELEGNGDGRGMLEKVDYARLNSVNSVERQQELDNIAEEALKFQPKGYTLETTQVKTEVPFLIRGNLREYQMVGLDWLVTLYEKNLNGILADEMGLGKTIQTIALLAHLACSESIWGPHLIVVPTSVILNWEMELKKWCPAFKILTYFGSVKDRAEKRKGWSKPNAFHVCITSYKTITTDIRSFKMKAWQYLILDEAQNIKNWKSQRWQALLNIRARRRLLLTGTPLQNSLMELWSLMHFLMPAIFGSHDDFKEWFSSPLTGMMEGTVQYCPDLVNRLHKVLRPFILRRLKSEVEKQMPSKTEHIVKCELSKRQRYLYDDFMSKRSTRDNLKSGNMMSVLNIVMQLRKCCNHPNLFEPRPVVSPFALNPVKLALPAMVFDICGEDARLEDVKEIPSCLDIRNNLTGWNTNVQSRRPNIEELKYQMDDVRPPTVGGFRMQRPPLDRIDPCSTSNHSPSLNSVIDVSAAELQRAGFDQNDMFLVVNEGDDLERVISKSAGAPVPMRVRVDGGRVVLDNGENENRAGGIRVCQVVTVNGEKQLRDVAQNGDMSHSLAHVPVSVADIAEPSAARLPGPGSATTRAVPVTLPQRDVYGKVARRSVVIHPSLRTNTVVSSPGLSPLTVSTATSGFHHTMANGGAREPIVNYNYQFSPPLKRRKTTESPLISGEYSDCVPMDVCDSIREARQGRLEIYQSRFGTIKRPILPNELLSVLWSEVRKVHREEDDDKWEWNGWNCEKEQVQEFINEYTGRLMRKFVLHVDVAQADSFEVSSSSLGRPAYARFNEQMREHTTRWFLQQSHPLTDQKLLCSRLQFPELRLIEYDCGKLQVLANLLRELFIYKHRCLIFTQMSKMLDVLQAFLSFHGYQYFRLDGTTGIEQRQAMMERFNADNKIFCFILSTRSGGVGVNLTGADTVIFYDSDWNPTMDAQAQDRCHRIGQTRNVSIYRLISERTIEENILRKANQKRRLGQMAIDEAGFTPDFFKQTDTIRDLFDGEDVADEVVAAIDGPADQKSLEKAMAALEDEQDVVATKMATAEAKADRAEFDETKIPPGGPLGQSEPQDEKYLELINQLKPIERYAVKFLEAEYKPEFEEEVKEAEALIEQKKEDWQRAHEKAMNDGTGDEPEQDDFYGCGSLLDEILAEGPDAFDQMMPTWAPPTPPLSDGDVYYDDCLDLLYDPDFMGEAKLPSTIHELHRPLMKQPSPVKRQISTPSHSHAQSSVDQAVMQLLNNLPQQGGMYTSNGASPMAYDQYDYGMMDFADIKTEEPFANIAPFAPQRKEKRRQDRSHQQRDLMRAVTPPRPQREEIDYDGPEWSIIEDKAMLEATRNEDRMKHSFERSKTAMHYNWEYISGYVNRVTGFYRSPRQCSIRYQVTIRPREAGQLLAMDPISKKPKKLPLTQAEVIHMRKGRVTTDLQYEHDVSKLLDAKVVGRARTLKMITAKTRPPYRRSVENVTIESLNGRLPGNHETKLNELGVRHSSILLAEDIVRVHEEKHFATEQRKKNAEKLNEDRVTSPVFRSTMVTVRPPAVIAGSGLCLSKSPYVIDVPTIQPIRQPQQPQHPVHIHQPPSAMQSSSAVSQDHPTTSQLPLPMSTGLTRRVASVGGGMQHMVPQGQTNYLVVGHETGQAGIRVQRADAGGPVAGQPVYRSLTTQAKRTPPATPGTMAGGLTRAPVGYVTSGAGQSSSSGSFISGGQGGSALYSAGQGMQGGVQRQQGRVLSRGGRMFMAPSSERTYVMQQPQIRMGMVPASAAQRLPQQKRPIGAKPGGTVTTMMMGRPGQSLQQIRTVPRGGQMGSQIPAGSRIMNVVMAPGTNALRTTSGQIIGHHGSATMTRQLLSTRGMGVSRQGSPQTVAQVVIAPPASMQQQQHHVPMSQSSHHHPQLQQQMQQHQSSSSMDHAPTLAPAHQQQPQQQHHMVKVSTSSGQQQQQQPSAPSSSAPNTSTHSGSSVQQQHQSGPAQ